MMSTHLLPIAGEIVKLSVTGNALINYAAVNVTLEQATEKDLEAAKASDPQGTQALLDYVKPKGQIDFGAE
jgi:hypothetical protein